jgi:hypothetical protein
MDKRAYADAGGGSVQIYWNFDMYRFLLYACIDTVQNILPVLPLLYLIAWTQETYFFPENIEY